MNTITRTTFLNAAGLAAALCIAGAAPALAVDGEILINQAKVNAGNITPGDTAGFPATLSRPGRYKLTGNLQAPSGTGGIEVTANDVTIDLNGFTISHSPQSLGYGVHAQNVARIRIGNGTISGFGTAGIGGSDFVVVENMRLLANGTAISVNQQARIRDNTIAQNGTGISCGQCVVEQNIVTGNSASGAVLVGGYSTLLGNVLVGNGAWGMTSLFEASGYGENILIGNNGGGEQVTGTVASQLHPNYCNPACP
jgi:hypothetical protein